MLGARAHAPRRKRGVDDAGALPDLHVLAAGLALDVVAQVDVRQEQDGFSAGIEFTTCHGVARGADDVAFGLHLRRSC
jgi:hypothetical protein